MSKATKFLVTIAALNLLGVGLPALADDVPTDHGGRRADILDAYDANGDGRLSGTEFDDFREVRGEVRGEKKQRRVGRFDAAADADGDGSVSDDERRAARKSRKLERWDSDGDGSISDAERSAGRDASSRRRESNLEKYDADGDGHLGRSERKSARADGAKLGHRGRKGQGRRDGGRPPRGEAP